MICNKVVFPHPLEPRRMRTSLIFILILISLKKNLLCLFADNFSITNTFYEFIDAILIDLKIDDNFKIDLKEMRIEQRIRNIIFEQKK